MVQILQLLPGGGAEALCQPVQVGGTQLHGLVANVDHVLGAGLVLGADVAEPCERADRDDIRIGDKGDVASEPTITTSLFTQMHRKQNGCYQSVSL